MPKKNAGRLNRVLGIVVICVIVITASVAGLWFWLKQGTEPIDKNLSEQVVRIPVKTEPVIDYNKLKEDKELQLSMQERKAKYGIEKGIDIIVKSDESIKIGSSTVPMQEIIEKMRLKSGDIIEKDVESTAADSNEKIEAFGIYIVRHGDNIWNIHFKFLKDCFDHKGISISPLADEPDRLGFSSGVGKILKFSENMVSIYNIRERKLDVDLDLIIPLNKIVIYNIDRIFALLNQIDYSNVNRIHFDGETLWIPAEQ